MNCKNNYFIYLLHDITETHLQVTQQFIYLKCLHILFNKCGDVWW